MEEAKPSGSPVQLIAAPNASRSRRFRLHIRMRYSRGIIIHSGRYAAYKFRHGRYEYFGNRYTRARARAYSLEIRGGNPGGTRGNLSNFLAGMANRCWNAIPSWSAGYRREDTTRSSRVSLLRAGTC